MPAGLPVPSKYERSCPHKFLLRFTTRISVVTVYKENYLMTVRAVAENLFVQGAMPHLVGGRHRDSGKYVFPFPEGEEVHAYERVALNPVGTLWSWTIQRFRPKSPPYIGPEAFEPYAVGYVELAGQVIVETRIVNVNFDAIRIGDRYRTTVIPFARDADGTVVMTYAFEPAERLAA